MNTQHYSMGPQRVMYQWYLTNTSTRQNAFYHVVYIPYSVVRTSGSWCGYIKTLHDPHGPASVDEQALVVFRYGKRTSHSWQIGMGGTVSAKVGDAGEMLAVAQEKINEKVSPYSLVASFPSVFEDQNREGENMAGVSTHWWLDTWLANALARAAVPSIPSEWSLAASTGHVGREPEWLPDLLRQAEMARCDVDTGTASGLRRALEVRDRLCKQVSDLRSSIEQAESSVEVLSMLIEQQIKT